LNKGSDIDLDKSEKITHEQEIIEKLSIAAPIGIGVVVDRIFTFANSFLCKMLEYSREELMGNSSIMIYPTREDYEFVGKEKYGQLNKYGFGTVETRFRTKTGRVLNVILSSTRVDQNDFSKGTIFTVLDITERKIMEEKNKQLNENLKILNKILRHDIANNLTVVSIALEIMETNDQDLKNKAFNAVKRSADLIEKIRNLESTMIKRYELKLVSIRQITELIKKNYSNISITISGECEVMADEALTSVIDNIINNSIVHGETDRIDIEVTSDENICQIGIIDYGKGIPDVIKKRIFDEEFSYGKNKGTGLGLYIAKKTIERYGGEIEVKDTKPQGATFVLKLKRSKL